MSITSRLLNGLGIEERATLANPPDSLLEAFGATSSYSGQTVSVDGSLALVPVFSAVSRIAGAVGSMPMLVYRRTTDGRERADNHRTWKLLHSQPNPEMAADEFWELLTGHLLLWGNAFVGKLRGPMGLVDELWPIRPSRVQVGKREDGSRYFILDGKDEHTEFDILHIRAFGTDGIVGLSPIQQARQQLGATLALEEFSGRFWDSSANPSGILVHPNRLSEEAAERIKARWRANHTGVRNAGGVAVLEEGMTWQSVGMPLEDAQFLETAKFSDVRVAQIFNLPPYMLGASSGDSLTYATTESQGIDFVRWTLNRWLTRIENSILRDEGIFRQGERIYPEFLREALLQADTKTRYEAYEVAVRTGWLTNPEIRVKENLPPADVPAGLELEAADVPVEQNGHKPNRRLSGKVARSATHSG